MKPHLAIRVWLLLLALCASALAQNTVITYQGRVTSNGTNFSGQGQFKAALVNVTNNNRTATATANPPSGGFITVISLTFGGSGYITAPSVTLTGGGGSGATAIANVNGGAVTGVTVSNPGGGYTSAPTVLIAPPPPALVFTTRWSNDGTSSGGSEPVAAVTAGVTNGLFVLRLGDATLPNMAALDAVLFQRPDLHVRLWFNDGVSGFAALSPAQPLTATPYASFADTARGLAVASNQSLSLTINGAPALRISDAYSPSFLDYLPNLAGGYSGNIISNGVVGGFIGGGGSFGSGRNTVGGDFASVLGGQGNTASGYASTAIGYNNRVIGPNAAALGVQNIVSGGSSVAIGVNGTANGDDSMTIGFGCKATGSLTTAMGYGSAANHYGSFVWADTQAAEFPSTAADQFSVRALGGVRLVGNVQIGDGSGDYRRLELGGGNSSGFLYGSYPQYGDGIHLSYNYYARGGGPGGNVIVNPGGATSRLTVGYGFITLSVGAVNNAPYVERLNANEAGVTVRGTFNNLSDRNAKQDFEPVDAGEILEAVTRLPISQWSYKEDPRTRHIGPMAQDFHAAFNVGTDDKHIAPIDEGGVALAAIQGLNQALEEKEQRIRGLEAAVRELQELIRKGTEAAK